jgi:hypothetical protein
MSRRKSTLKHAVELYLIIVGGGYTLTSVVALIYNAQWLLTSSEQAEIRGLRSEISDNCIMLIAAAATLSAGVGIYKYRRWGLVLAAVMSLAAIAECVAASAIEPWEYHTFTIGLPMAAIMLWALLPPTWGKFQQESTKIS